MTEAASKPKSSGNLVVDYFRDFAILKENPREYWGIQVINFLDSAAYFALLTIVSVFLSTDLGFDDKGAGYVITAFTSAVTICLLFSGVATDVLGIRKSLWLAMAGKAVLHLGIVLLALGPNFNGRGIVVAVLLFLMAPFLAMVQTLFQAANQRYTTVRSRSAGFNLWYLFMNVGAAAAGLLVDLVRLWLKLPSTWVVAVGAVTSVLSLVVGLLWVRTDEQVYGPGEARDEVKPDAEKPKKKSPFEILKGMVKETAFWRFVVLVAMLLGVRAVFVYMYLLMPKYWIRVMGPDAAIGLLNTINPVLIIVGLILFIPLTNKFNIFKMLVYGAAVSALAVFALLIPWQWLSSDLVTAYNTMAIISMVLLSIGEVIWSPKLSEYTAAIAPKGQEGSYLGMSMMPWFLAKTVVGVLSGHMLGRWVPEGIGERIRAGTVGFWDRPEGMWLILGIWAIAGPVMALVFQKWLTQGARWKTS
jgi:MFS family permease